MNSIGLTHNAQIWANLGISPIRGKGHVQPTLIFPLEAQTPADGIQVQIDQLYAKLSFNREMLGTGTVDEIGEEIRSGGRQLHLEIPINREAIRFVQDHARDHSLNFELECHGLLWVIDSRSGGPVSASEERGKWRLVPVKSGSVRISIYRSDWVKNVLEPLGIGKYILLELPIPDVPEPERWKKALDHLEDAQNHFHMGNDAAILHLCHAAFEGLEGAPKNIFDQMADEKKRRAVDDLLKQAMDYFHSGRHVSKSSGPQQGTFPVDHRDAEFALYLSRTFMAYIAKLLVSNQDVG